MLSSSRYRSELSRYLDLGSWNAISMFPLGSPSKVPFESVLICIDSSHMQNAVERLSWVSACELGSEARFGSIALATESGCTPLVILVIINNEWRSTVRPSREQMRQELGSRVAVSVRETADGTLLRTSPSANIHQKLEIREGSTNDILYVERLQSSGVKRTANFEDRGKRAVRPASSP